MNEENALMHSISVLDRLLDLFPIQDVQNQVSLKNRWSIPSPKYMKDGSEEYLSYNCKELSKEGIIKELITELKVPYICMNDPEAHSWVVAYFTMLAKNLTSYYYKWGAHKMEVEIYRFDADRYALVHIQYVDFYA
jgi:hypothetical protein